MRTRSLPAFLTFGTALLFGVPLLAQASYLPGATLDPSCLPTDSTCIVTSLTASSTATSFPYYAANGSVLSATSTLTLLTNGNFGIGTTTPAQPLSVTGKIYTTGGIQFPDGSLQTAAAAAAAVGTQGQIAFYNTNGSTVSGTSTITILQSGNVGIGTTSPYSMLSVAGQVVGQNFVAISTTATSTFANAITIGTQPSSPPNATLYVSSTYGPGFIFDNYGTNSANIQQRHALGLVGNPQALTSGTVIGQNSFMGYGVTNFPSGATAIIRAVAAENFTDSAMGTYLAFRTTPIGSITSAEALRIDTTGNIGIGTTSPYSMLSVAGQVVGQNFVATSTTATSTFAGAVGIGTVVPLGSLDVRGAGYFKSQANAFNTTSAYTALVLDGGITGALFAIGRANSALEPYTAVSGYDSGTDRGLYYGGGGWNVPDANTHYFYTAPTYTETNDAGVLRLTISSTAITSTVPYVSAAGDATAPTYTFTADTDTGIFGIPGIGNIIGFSAAGVERMRINAAGVGIGTTSPYSMLSVAGQVVGQNFVATSTTATSTFAGAVGIGTTSPNANFALQGTTARTQNLFNIASSTGASLVAITSNGDLSVTRGTISGGTTNQILNVSGTRTVGNGNGDPSLPAGAISSTLTVNPTVDDSDYSGNRFQTTFSGSIAYSGGIMGSTNFARQNGSGSLASAFGAYNLVNKTGTGAITSAYGSYNNINNGGASGAITNAFGVYSFLSGVLAGITNGYGLYIDQHTGTITNSYALYSADTSNSYFAGNLGIGTTSPYSMLSVAGQVVGQNFVATSTTAVSTFAGSVGVGTTSPNANLALQGTTGQTGSLFNIASSTGAPLVSIDSGGGLVINRGTVSSGSGNIFTVMGTKIAGNGNLDITAPTMGVNATLFVNPTADDADYFGNKLQTAYNGTISYSGGIAGGVNIAKMSSGSGVTLAKAYGSYDVVQQASLGTVTSAYGSFGEVAGSAIGAITNAYGFYSYVHSSASNITNGYGLYISGMTGVSNTYALYTAGTEKSYFGGNVGVGTTSPYAPLSVVGQVVGSYFTATSTTATSTLTAGVSVGSGNGYWINSVNVLASNVVSASTNAISGVTGNFAVGTANTLSSSASAGFAGGISNTVSSILGGVAVGKTNTASGSGTAVAFGISNTSSGTLSLAFGYNNTSSGGGSGVPSSAFGGYDIASANKSSAFGYLNLASGVTSSAFGASTTASALLSSSFGYNTTASAQGAIAVGSDIINNTASSTMIGPSDAAKLTILGATGSVGYVGIGTSTPYARLTVWGPDSAATTSALTVANSASTTVFSVYDNGNATYSGSIFQSSDRGLKTGITPLEASSSLAAVLGLNPVSYTRLDQPDEGTNLGFIAQDVQQIFPELVSTTSPTTLTPNGTLTLNYVGLIAPIVEAIKALAGEMGGFAQSITTAVLNATTVNTNKLCLAKSDGSKVCLTGDELDTLLNKQGDPSSSSPVPATIPPPPTPTPLPLPEDLPSMPPIVITDVVTTSTTATTTVEAPAPTASSSSSDIIVPLDSPASTTPSN